MMNRFCAAFFGLAAILTIAPTSAAETVTIAGSRAVLIKPAAPQASVILMPGSDGVIQAGDHGDIHGLNGNQLVRTRYAYAARRLAVLVVDVSTDLRSAVDYMAAIKRPVTVVATSAGAASDGALASSRGEIRAKHELAFETASLEATVSIGDLLEGDPLGDARPNGTTCQQPEQLLQILLEPAGMSRTHGIDRVEAGSPAAGQQSPQVQSRDLHHDREHPTLCLHARRKADGTEQATWLERRVGAAIAVFANAVDDDVESTRQNPREVLMLVVDWRCPQVLDERHVLAAYGAPQLEAGQSP
jgi:hypothetical protein